MPYLCNPLDILLLYHGVRYGHCVVAVECLQTMLACGALMLGVCQLNGHGIESVYISVMVAAC